MTVSLTTKSGELELYLIDNEENGNYSAIDPDSKKVLVEVKYSNGVAKILQKDEVVDQDDDNLSSQFNEYYFSIIENLQSGTEGDGDKLEVEDKPYDPDKIRVDTRSFSLRQIYDMINNEDLVLNPDFQRYFVWDNTRQSRLIESILLRIPLPMFYFSQDDEGKIAVVDGLQRLSSIKKFMDNELQLKNLEYLDRCNGKFYQTGDSNNDIDARYFRSFNMTQIVVNIIDPSSPAEVKYDIFRRINTGGRPLNAQEIRNCLAKPHLRELLNAMANNESFKLTTLGSIKNARMEAQEMALRFITFYDYLKNTDPSEETFLSRYSGSMASTLDLKTEELNRRSDLFDYEKLYETAMNNAKFLFGDYAFRKCFIEHLEPEARKQLINKALFVSWSVLLATIDQKEIRANYRKGSLALPLAKEMTHDSKFFNSMTFGTNGRSNVIAAFRKALEILK